MRRLGFVLALTLVGGGAALADSNTSKTSDVGDKGFVDKAATAGMAEVKLGKLAMEKGQSTEVKQFARKMVEDHSKANMELKQIAEKQNLTVPTKLDEKQQMTYDKLAKLDGSQFDKEYLRAMSEDHNDAVKLFKDEAQTGQNPELKSYAMKTLPVLEKHEDLAHRDQQQLMMKMKEMPQK